VKRDAKEILMWILFGSLFKLLKIYDIYETTGNLKLTGQLILWNYY
jgi:hypothetical protein